MSLKTRAMRKLLIYQEIGAVNSLHCATYWGVLVCIDRLNRYGKKSSRSRKKPAWQSREKFNHLKKTPKNASYMFFSYQLYTFWLRMSSFISRKKKCFQLIWRKAYLVELLYCSLQNHQYECFQTVKNIAFFIFEITSIEERKREHLTRTVLIPYKIFKDISHFKRFFFLF